MEVPPRLRMQALTVEFGATRALDAVTVDIHPGEIVGLLGHNGAGKSTLFNVVSGALPAADGEIAIDGETIPARPTPAEMSRRGITVIHQEPALAHNLTVAENLFLGQERLVARSGRSRLAADALERVGAHLDAREMVAALDLGERQLVDLARGLVRGEIKVLMLDEPTAALGRAETDALHALIRTLAAEGVAVIYVSHRLPDILDVCERILILRAGSLVVDGPAREFDGPSLSAALAPEAAFTAFERRDRAASSALALPAPYNGVHAGRGEVVGLFGMAAGEQFHLLESLYGTCGRYDFSLNGTPMTVDGPSSALRRGIHLVPADRERDGLVSGTSAVDTVLSPWFQAIRRWRWWISGRSGAAVYARARSTFAILGPDGAAPIDEFSGGNRQKHLIARWTSVRDPQLLLLAQPTQGVDVGARVDIAHAVRSIADEGASVLVASAESDEIELLCDRAYVIYEGRVAEVDRSESFGADLLTALLGLAEPVAKGVVR